MKKVERYEPICAKDRKAAKQEADFVRRVMNKRRSWLKEIEIERLKNEIASGT